MGTDVGKYVCHLQHPALQSKSEKLLIDYSDIGIDTISPLKSVPILDKSVIGVIKNFTFRCVSCPCLCPVFMFMVMPMFMFFSFFYLHVRVHVHVHAHVHGHGHGQDMDTDIEMDLIQILYIIEKLIRYPQQYLIPPLWSHIRVLISYSV